MRTSLISTLLCVALVSPLCAEGKTTTTVVELFTSEGCSSCPRADELLGEITSQVWDTGEVYGLAFHVDYWDRLGWRDRFSNSTFTKRQYRYAEQLPDSRVYTPQMIVDGQVGFVGSDRAKATTAIRTALSKADEVGVELTVGRLSGDAASLEYKLRSIRDGLVLNVALTQRVATTDVKHGENGGQKLAHHHVVRSFKNFPAGSNPEGKARIRIPEDVQAEELDAIVYVQDRESFVILGAARIPLKGE